MKYTISKMFEQFESGVDLDFLFFWGHTSAEDRVTKQCLSQWYEAPFLFDGVTYQTSEHWMMAQKALLFRDPDSFRKIINNDSVREVKALGRKVKNFGPDIWNENKFQIVVKGNLHKFTQNAKLFDYLKGTGERYLIEASPNDQIWGIGISEEHQDIDNPYLWQGENLLGFALMEVRDQLNKFEYFRLLDDPLPPPWETYADIECGDMFWRMGGGEDYLNNFFEWFSGLSETDKEIYRITYPHKNGWDF